MKILTAIGILLGITLLGLSLKVLLFPAHVATKEIQMAYDITDKTLEAENAIYNYEWFKQQKEDIEASRAKLVVAENSIDRFKFDAVNREHWTFEDKTEYSRLNSIAQGLENYLTQQIADYNARAKMANRNIFENGLLPNFIDATTMLLKK
ncbi:MAG TPA: hypothetical protein DDY52_03390 [Candidatus Moranbacteria bacterium]|nr:hypothetical protein [Candidatus Moranbacteria bacterium]